MNLIPKFISEKFRNNELQGAFQGFTMFIDISGFTNLTEKLMTQKKDGAEVLTDILNKIFEPVIEKIIENDGIISTFAGDAFTTIFHEEDINIIETALFIQNFFFENKQVNTIFGEFDLGVKIGLSYGNIKWGIIGEDRHYTYYFSGNAIDGCANAEHNAEKGEIILDLNIISKLEIHKEFLTKKSKKYFALKSLNKYDLNKKVMQEKVSIENETLDYFLPNIVNHLSSRAEFREVTPVFISFEESGKNVKDFVIKILKATYKFGGYFNKIDFGDKGGVILVLFGAPISYENNISRALDFILEIKTTTNLQFRAGLTHGTVYAGIIGSEERCEYTAIGDVVNLAARFMMKAQWNQVLLSKNITSNLEKNYEFKKIGDFLFKGITKEIETFELIKKEENIAIFDGKIIGRNQELRKLHKFIGPLYSHKFAGIIYVFGEAGIGKSRLCWEFRKSLEKKGTKHFYLPCDQILKSSFNPFIYFLKNYFHVSNNNSNLENQEKFEDIFGRLWEKANYLQNVDEVQNALKRIKPTIKGFLGLNQENTIYNDLDSKGRYENFCIAIKELFKIESILQPIIIEIDDSQWIDIDSKELLKKLTCNIKDFPIAILSIARYADDGTEFRFDFDKDIPLSKIDLSFLNKKNISSYAQNILKTNYALTKDLVDFLYEKTNGNPFFLEQLLLDLKDKIKLIQSGKRKKLSIDKNVMKEVPSNIQSLVISRLDRLTEKVKDVVQTAAVLGKEFIISVLDNMLIHKEISRSEIEQAEHEKIWSSVSEIKYIFKHALLRDSAYDMQLRKKLRLLHKLAAESYETIFKNNINQFYNEIAFHYDKAQIEEKAIEYLKKAGDFAVKNYQNFDAMKAYSRLLENYNLKNDEQFDIQVKLGDIFLILGKWDDAGNIYDKSIISAQTSQKADFLVTSYLKKSYLLYRKGDYEKSMGLYEKADEINHELNDKNLQQKILSGIAQLYFSQGEYDISMKYYKKQLKILKSMKIEKELGNIYGNIGLIYLNQSNYSKAMEYFQKNLEIAEKNNDKISLNRVLGNIGLIYASQCDYENALIYHKRKLEIANELGMISEKGKALSNMGIIYWYQAKFEDAKTAFEKNLEIARELGDKQEVSIAVGNVGNVYNYIGDFENAMKCYEEDLAISKELNNKKGIGKAIGNIGIIYYKKRDYEKAKKCYLKKLEISKELGNKKSISTALGNIANIFSDQEDYKNALKFFKQKLTIVENLGDKYEISRAKGNIALVFYKREEYKKAIEYYEQSIKLDYEFKQKALLINHLYDLNNCLYVMKEYKSILENIEEIFEISLDIKSDEYIFPSKILQKKIIFENSKNIEEKNKIIDEMINLFQKECHDENRALLSYEIASMYKKLNRPDNKYAKIALELNSKLYK